jgi:hypothetical protein
MIPMGTWAWAWMVRMTIVVYRTDVLYGLLNKTQFRKTSLDILF